MLVLVVASPMRLDPKLDRALLWTHVAIVSGDYQPIIGTHVNTTGEATARPVRQRRTKVNRRCPQGIVRVGGLIELKQQQRIAVRYRLSGRGCNDQQREY